RYLAAAGGPDEGAVVRRLVCGRAGIRCRGFRLRRDQLFEVGVVVRQQVPGHGDARRQQGLHGHDVAAAVQAEGPGDRAVGDVEGDEVPFLDGAAHDDVVPARGIARVLDAVVVLVGPEPVRVVVPRAHAEHVECRGGSVPGRVVEVLDAHAAVVQRVIVVGDVAGGVDALGGAAAELIHADAVADRDLGVLRDLDVRFDADADHRGVALYPFPVARRDDDPGARPDDRLHGRV